MHGVDSHQCSGTAHAQEVAKIGVKNILDEHKQHTFSGEDGFIQTTLKKLYDAASGILQVDAAALSVFYHHVGNSINHCLVLAEAYETG